MLKKLIILLLFLVTASVTQAQLRSAKDLLGRWRTTYTSGKVSDIQFLTDSTGAFLSATGIIDGYIEYTADFKKDIIKFRLTLDIHRAKHRNYGNVEIKFLNDSTFLVKFGGSFPEKADTNTKKLFIYRKLNGIPAGTELRLPTYHDLIGRWSANSEKSKIDNHIVFIDENHLSVKLGDVTRELNYNVDFTKQPMPIDFYNQDNNKVLQGFLMFDSRLSGDDCLWIEFFPKNNRGDHFEMLGKNGLFKKVKAEAEK